MCGWTDGHTDLSHYTVYDSVGPSVGLAQARPNYTRFRELLHSTIFSVFGTEMRVIRYCILVRVLK